MDAEENSAVRLLWMQRRTVLTVQTVVDTEENSAAVRLLECRREQFCCEMLWMQRRTVL